MNADFVPDSNRPETVYGPPEWFTNESELTDITGTEPQDVYGPPGWFSETETTPSFAPSLTALLDTGALWAAAGAGCAGETVVPGEVVLVGTEALSSLFCAV